MTASDDQAPLIAACARGERAALKSIYEREAAVMLGVAARIVRRRELAEEVVHDAFVRIWRHAGSFDPALGSARAWLFAIVHNRAIDALRDVSREQTVDEEEIAAVDTDAVSEDAFKRLSESSALKRCLEKLDQRRRLGVLLAYVEGLSHGEIAARLKVPLGTAKALVRRGLSEIGSCLA